MILIIELKESGGLDIWTYSCSICFKELQIDEEAICIEEKRICRDCTKQLARFFDVNKTRILSL